MLNTADRIFIPVDKTPERDGQMDEQTENAFAITALGIASNADALYNKLKK